MFIENQNTREMLSRVLKSTAHRAVSWARRQEIQQRGFEEELGS